MEFRSPRSRRFLVPSVLAAVLAIEITGIALAHGLAPAPAPVASSTGAAAAPVVSGPSRSAEDRRAGAATDLASARSFRTSAAATADATARADATRRSARSATTTSTRSGPPSAPRSGQYHGTNRVWIPSIGVDKGIESFPCSRSRPPDAGVYRWGCSGTNNVYLLGHAWSTFRTLHDAYVGGRLRKGMRVIYADGSGTVHTYRVVWWRVTLPTTAAAWAWASLATPSMTLQTCVGSNSQYRLMVRLIRSA